MCRIGGAFVSDRRERESAMKVTTVGLDLAKPVFSVYGQARSAQPLGRSGTGATRHSRAAVALAAKNARIAWALLSRDQTLRAA